MVIVVLNAIKASNIATNDVIATLPTGFRPSNTVISAATIAQENASVGAYAGLLIIENGGVLRPIFSSAVNPRIIWAIAVYSV